jgi:single-stranded DNA-specific DHH superfamily exonuclease
MAEAEKQAEADNEQKNKELLRKLEEHKEEQKKLLQEQKQILEELKEHKKDIEQAAAAKQRSDDNIPKGSSGIVQDGGVKPEGKIDINIRQSVENIPSPQSGVPGIKMVQNKNNVGNDIQKAQNEEAHKQNKVEKKDVPQPVKVDAPEKDQAGEGPNHLDDMEQLPKNSVLQGRSKGASINAGNVEMSG